jgi:hypothetical protein
MAYYHCTQVQMHVLALVELLLLLLALLLLPIEVYEHAMQSECTRAALLAFKCASTHTRTLVACVLLQLRCYSDIASTL